MFKRETHMKVILNYLFIPYHALITIKIINIIIILIVFIYVFLFDFIILIILYLYFSHLFPLSRIAPAILLNGKGERIREAYRLSPPFSWCYCSTMRRWCRHIFKSSIQCLQYLRKCS